MVEEELGGELGFGPWSLVWWWMQNEDDPLKRLTVTNCWAERDLMRTLRQWRREAEVAGMSRIAELCDYLQADERMHVRLATDWIRRLADGDRQDELGGELGYGPWSLVWWWMQNEDDPLRRLTVTNCWAERDLMRTLRRWRREATEQGMDRIADLCDYLQADERMHVRLATEWIRRLADADE